MIALTELLNRLGYDKSPNYRPTDGPLEPETAHLFRAARDVNVHGIYVFETSADSTQRILPARPAVHVAEALNEEQARQIHRSLWNLSYAPFLIVRLPHQIRIYTGFDYSQESPEEGLLGFTAEPDRLPRLLRDFTSDAVDTGHIWESKYAKKLDPNQRVDKRLLSNLEQLGRALKESGLRDEVAHALIGQYVYLSYLRDRDILSDEWLAQHRITPHNVVTHRATVSSLRKLVEALEDRFNGKIFPIEFDREDSLKDDHVSWVASVFSGAEIKDTAPEIVRQLHLPFQAYDFRYIPVETLSAIYEQFIYERKAKGAIYTPEALADYVLSEVEWAKPLARGMRILDPACGSGVFLVLTYRRLIEKEIARLGRRLKPEELCEILQESIYGVERERDACYVTEFSLILTLLHYMEPRDLRNLEFQFPDLHNKQVFEHDFFDVEDQEGTGKFWQRGVEFDWIVGNPPWIELKPNTNGEEFARAWMDNPRNRSERPIGGNRVAEAFSWLVTDLLSPEGVVGLILPATSLFNLESQNYRRHFFTKHEVLRITNFANLRDVLFDRRGTFPAVTIIYRRAVDSREKPPIIHYGPFAVNQLSEARKKPWVITINENEIQTISPYEAEKGETSLWKFALWGTYRDRRATERIRCLFPKTLSGICEKRGWPFWEGAQLRDRSTKSNYELEHVAELRGKKRFRTDLMNQSLLRFSISQDVLENIPDEMCYIRKRGGKAGLSVTQAPHVILSPGWMSYIVYSDEDFVIPPRQMGIAAPEGDADYLRALSVFLNSSLVAYYLFFHAQQWGVFRQARLVSIAEVREIPTPELTPKQVEDLASFHEELVGVERREISNLISGVRSRTQTRLGLNNTYATEDIAELGFPEKLTRAEKKDLRQSVAELRKGLRNTIDERVVDLFNIPRDIELLVEEFVQIRLSLDKPSAIESTTRKPSNQELVAYARELRDELDDFVMGTAYHKVSITHSEELIECIVEITQEDAPIPVNGNSIKVGDLTTTRLLAELSDSLREQVSQWVYVRRGLHLFDGPRVYIYKIPRLVDWTRTQAMNDASDIIGEALEAAWKPYEDK